MRRAGAVDPVDEAVGFGIPEAVRIILDDGGRKNVAQAQIFPGRLTAPKLRFQLGQQLEEMSRERCGHAFRAVLHDLILVKHVRPEQISGVDVGLRNPHCR